MQAVHSKQEDARRRSAAVSTRDAEQLTMYGTPPAEDITLEEFEGLAIDRLRGAAPRESAAGLLATRLGVRACVPV